MPRFGPTSCLHALAVSRRVPRISRILKKQTKETEPHSHANTFGNLRIKA